MAHFGVISKATNKVVTVIRVDNSKIQVPTQQLQIVNVAKLGEPEKLEERMVTVMVDDEQKGIDFLSNVLKDTYPSDQFEYHQTSYNEKIRYNFASIGDTFDKVNGAFIKPMPVEVPIKVKEVLVKGQLQSLSTPLVGNWELDQNYKWKFNEANLLSRMARNVTEAVSSVAKDISVKKVEKMSYLKYFMKDLANAFVVVFCTVFFGGITYYLRNEGWAILTAALGIGIDAIAIIDVYIRWKKYGK